MAGIHAGRLENLDDIRNKDDEGRVDPLYFSTTGKPEASTNQYMILRYLKFTLSDGFTPLEFGDASLRWRRR